MNDAAKRMRTLRVAGAVLLICLFCLNAHAGYTQYWTWHGKPNDSDLKACVQEMTRLIEACTNILEGPDGDGPVVISTSHVDFNGIGDDAHEPFHFPGNPGFNFCKTEGKPYDAVVTGCLLVARDHFPQSVLAIDSDGSWQRGAWQEGIKLYSSVLHRPVRNPMNPGWRVVQFPLNLLYLVPPALVAGVAFLWFRKIRHS